MGRGSKTLDRILSVTIQGQRSPGRVDPGWVRSVIERYRREGIEPSILVEATHGSSHVRFTHPPPPPGKSRPLDKWEAATAQLWHEHRLNASPIDVVQLCAFLGRVQNML